MKRDMELIREIMLKLEELPMGMGEAKTISPQFLQDEIPDHSVDEINHHMDLIHSAGWIDDGGSLSAQPMLGFIFMGLTMSGHDFLDTVRSPEVWSRTKAGAKQVGSFGLQLLADLAKGYAKQLAHEHGLPVS